MILASSGIIAGKGSVPIDADAQAFITAATITDSTQQSAINVLVTSLKSANIWNKMKAIYPFVGGTATTHKWNLKDPRDLDEAFRLVFNGGWTHNSGGALPNGTTGYATTYYNPSSNFTLFLGYYSVTNGNTGTDQIDMGSTDLIKWTWLSAWYKTGVYNNILATNSRATPLLNGGVQTDSRGWYWINKVGTTSKLGKNTNILTSDTDNVNPGSRRIAIGALGTPTGANYYSNRATAFSVIAEGLSDADTSNLYTLIQTFQTTLGRQV